LKSILKNTNSNHPADGEFFIPAAMMSGMRDQLAKDMLEEKKEEKKPVAAFTSVPASSNEKLMEFEALLMAKAGKKPPLQNEMI